MSFNFDVSFFFIEVVFTTENTIQVTVQTDVVNPERKTTNTTNTFHFTFVVDSKTPIPQVTFSKYEDAMQYLSGKRRYELGKKLEAKESKKMFNNGQNHFISEHKF